VQPLVAVGSLCLRVARLCYRYFLCSGMFTFSVMFHSMKPNEVYRRFNFAGNELEDNLSTHVVHNIGYSVTLRCYISSNAAWRKAGS
jgi:hypothetical protein